MATMAQKFRRRNGIMNKINYINPRNEHGRGSKFITKRDKCVCFNKNTAFKVNNYNNVHKKTKSTKTWINKTNLVRQQLNSELSSNIYGQNRNNFKRRKHNRDNNNDKFRNKSWLQKSKSGWYLINIPNIDDNVKVLNIIQIHIAPVLINPFNKQYYNNTLQFLIDDFKVAIAIKNSSCKIPYQNNRKLVIKVQPYMPSRTLISLTPISNEIKEKILEVVTTRYTPHIKSLDLSEFYKCPLFTENQLFVPLNRPAVLLATLDIAARHTNHDLYGLSLGNNFMYLGEGIVWIRRLFPQLKVLDLSNNKFTDLIELKCFSGYNIEVLNMCGNPVCEKMKHYKEGVLNIFPKLKKLDNIEMPSRYSNIFDKFIMPINLDNSYPKFEDNKCEQSLKYLIENFLTQYYQLYDNNVSRCGVSMAYHDNATLSISSCFLFNFPKGNLTQYLPVSRNMLIDDTTKNDMNYFKGRENIVNFIEKLPKTKHDFGSFLVDVPIANNKIIHIVVNGVFAEEQEETACSPLFRSFSRIFCIIPMGNGWTIMSDMLYVTLVTDELLVASLKRCNIIKPIKKNLNSNNNNDIMENMDNMEVLQYHKKSFANNTLVTYQQSSYSHQLNSNILQVPQKQQLVMTQPTTSLQLNSQPSCPTFNELSTRFSINPTSPPVNQPSIEVSLNLENNFNINSDDKLAIINKFSNESGMIDIWAQKCLEDNNWDYSKAFLCFLILKANIPKSAFILNK